MNVLKQPERHVETPARFTIDEFMQLVDTGVFEGSRAELVEGVIVRMSPSMSRHMRYQREVLFALAEVLKEVGGNLIVQPNLSLKLDKATLREADLGVLPSFDDEHSFPDPSTVLLLVEISVSTLDYDLNVKRLDYARAGIPHYWVVDVEGRRSHVMSTPLDGDYAERHPVAFGEPLAVPETDRTIVID